MAEAQAATRADSVGAMPGLQAAVIVERAAEVVAAAGPAAAIAKHAVRHLIAKG